MSELKEQIREVVASVNCEQTSVFGATDQLEAIANEYAYDKCIAFAEWLLKNCTITNDGCAPTFQSARGLSTYRIATKELLSEFDKVFKKK